VELDTTEIQQVSFGQQQRGSTHLTFRDRASKTDVRGALAYVVEDIAITLAAPTRLFQPSPIPPCPAYFHLRLPDDLATNLRADSVHDQDFTGEGIRVAMVDTGHYWHPFFKAQGYCREDVVLTTTATNPQWDDHGHGTGESANLYAVAPKAKLVPIKAPLAGAWEGRITDSLIAATCAFKVAASLEPPPHVITCSWGYDLASRNDFIRYDAQVLALAIADAVARNIVVVFAAGNGDYGFPAQHSDVIAVGGAHITKDGELLTSDYASAFYSHIYNDSVCPSRLRRVPDVCGLIGMAPFARYLMLPVPPGSRLDETVSEQANDGTETDDGWAVFSGTSAAAPQVAGVVALMLQANPALIPGEVKQILQETAQDVPHGRSASVGGRRAHAKAGRPDVATGAGLVDAHAAVNRARNWP
jgi:subtilisin family serine protease